MDKTLFEDKSLVNLENPALFFMAGMPFWLLLTALR